MRARDRIAEIDSRAAAARHAAEAELQSPRPFTERADALDRVREHRASRERAQRSLGRGRER